ncbi:outer membrane beta-barrel family protein [Luteibaculum oceani]|uniref:outer membrane beta-barrel family protein n=1 Tax=Luteibaculum oceani TaxID=1294296 RepID=UPI001CB8F4D1|nr:outer membrane beta-barrel family protein [Luteibaculum oceani]
MKYLTFTFLLLFTSLFAIGQVYKISGKVLSASENHAIPYATVVVYNNSKEIIGGGSTNESGFFKIQTEEVGSYIDLSFIGFEKQRINTGFDNQYELNLGTIKLKSTTQQLGEFEVQAEKSTTEFKLDKRVFNVGQDISSTGMSAMELLNNVPSVRVNIEGQISLRGNTGVQILINGKPSVLADEGGNALGTLTSDMIEKIEVITNPSAKYDAEGSSGIINIVLKKEEKKGLNGSISVNTGIPDNHSLGLSLNKRTNNFNLFTQMGVGYRSLPRFEENINRNISSNREISSDGTSYRNETFYNLTLGTDYYINDLNVITLSGNFAYEIEDQPSEYLFTDQDPENNSYAQWIRTENTSATNPKYQYDLQYKKEFKNSEDHTLLFSAQGNFFGKDLDSEFQNKTLVGSTQDAKQKSNSTFSQADYLFKLDYTNPITDHITLETGGQYTLNNVENDFEVSNFNGSEFVIDSNFTNNFDFNQRVLGVYTTSSFEKGLWGLMLGLRIEHTLLDTYLEQGDSTNHQNYTNLFPSIHSSYKISELFSIQAGYSRRIYRPRLWDLNPFLTIRNNFNIRTGNPQLLPEFSDSYEIGGIFIFPKVSLNASVYRLNTTQIIERVSRVENEIVYTSPYNIGTKESTGIEINAKANISNKISVSGDFNYGSFKRKGNFANQDFDFQANQWNARTITKIKLPQQLDLEFTLNYQSVVRNFQGHTIDYAHFDLGARKKFWGGKGVLNFAIRDLFASRIRQTIVRQGDNRLFSFSQRGTFLTLGFSYGFGKGEAMTYSGRRR